MLKKLNYKEYSLKVPDVKPSDSTTKVVCSRFTSTLGILRSTYFELQLLITPLVSPNLSYILSMYLQLLSNRLTSVWLVWSFLKHSLKLSMKIKQQWQNNDSCPQGICGLVDVGRIPDVKPSTAQVKYAIFFAPSCLWRWGRVSYLRYWCVCLRVVVSNTYCVVFLFVLCTLYCQFLWIFHLWLPLRYSLMFIYLHLPQVIKLRPTYVINSCLNSYANIFMRTCGIFRGWFSKYFLFKSHPFSDV